MVEGSISNMLPDQAPFTAALNQASHYLQHTDDMRGFLQLIFDLSLRHSGADTGYLLLRKADDATFQVAIAQNSDGDSLAAEPDLATQTLINLSLESSQSVLVSNATGDGRLAGLPVEARGAAAYLVVPMLLGFRAAGLICLVSKRIGHFVEEQQLFVELLSTQAALVVERDRQVQIMSRVEDVQSEFISLTSHQLRVPLTAMSGYTDIILSGMAGPLTEQQESFLRTIRRNVDRMSILIDALSEMNRIDGGRRRFNLKAVDLTEILETAILAVEQDMAGRQQELVVDVDPALPFVLADRSAVAAVLQTLMDNASRYSPDEAIISTQLTFSGEQARIDVVDPGVGISIQDQNRLFTPFFRSDDPAIQDHIGWGLALAHSKKVIEALGGTIGFTSRLGQGSNFFFTIPLATAETESE